MTPSWRKPAGALVNRRARKRVADRGRAANRRGMVQADASPLDRIDAALARIETAIARREREAQAIRTRHAALKARMSEAVAALDDVLARGEVSG